MRTFSLSRIIPNSLRNLLGYKAFLMVYEKPNNSAFIINVVTVFYLFTFQTINPLKRRMAYPYKLFRSLILSIKESSVIIFNLSFPPNLNPNVQVPNK